MSQSREIKFEFIFENGKKEIFSLNDIVDIDGSISFGTIKHKRQFTGLLDKNLKEIYEGDVVRIKNVWTNGIKTSDMVGEIVFFECEFQVKDKDDNYLSIARYRERNEIIGNIYENPELLEDNK